MKKVSKFQTQDGMLHDSIQDAKRHAERVYGDKLISVSHEIRTISGLGGWDKVAEFND